MKHPARLLSGLALTLLASGAFAGEGKVVSAINTDMYTYVEIAQNDKTVWIAAPTVAAKPGNLIRFDDGMMMRNFYSKQLQRNFPEVMFVQSATITAEK